MEVFYISLKSFNKFIESLSKEFVCLVPMKFSAHDAPEKESLHYEKFNTELSEKIVVGEIRPSEPIKAVLNYSREKVDSVFKKKQVVIGVKACDINSLSLQDFVFKKVDPPDPFYVRKREDTYIISSDCDLLYENCFCTQAGNNPYSESGFDLNLSSSRNGYLVEVGSDKGKELIKNNDILFTDRVEKRQIEERNSRRKDFTAKLAKQVNDQGVPKFDFLKNKVKDKYTSKIWEEVSKTCIECGACNLGCPTCHCFLISDQKKDALTARFRSWDACLYKRFAVVAGGANPRKYIAERLRNRFEKKFDFFPRVLNKYACTGCGRCFEACPGKIDIREVLKELVK